MKTLTMYQTHEIDGRRVEEYRTGNQKFTITYPEGADVRIEHVGDVREIDERPVLPGDENENPLIWSYPVATHLLAPKEADGNG